MRLKNQGESSMPRKKSLVIDKTNRKRSKKVQPIDVDEEIVVASPVTIPETKPEPPKSEPIEEIKPESKIESKSELKSESKIELKTESKTELKSEVVREFPKKIQSDPPIKKFDPPITNFDVQIDRPNLAEKDLIFALDIGTRSVIGIVAETTEEGGLKILATAREEHKTRSMLDGQIHDVPQVAAVIRRVKNRLQKSTAKLKSAAVAAAGRALYTMTAEAEMDVNGTIDRDLQGAVDFAGVQAAQEKLAASQTIEDPTKYYCVGYSVMRYELDDAVLKTLIGQRGKHAKVKVIATFLPRQVIDSMQSALQDSNLEMRALTLEPIAAINVLIPQTMRHLNIVLVDIGAGTSDIAITRNGTVVAYGMVPIAGDEITESISQKFLLDFNVAEQVKRKAALGDPVQFQDVLGMTYELPAAEIIEPILPNVRNLSESIAHSILELNGGDIPQAVMLVGGGSMTPMLQQMVAKSLGMPENRVAVRKPDLIDGIEDVPDELHSPDAVTPLGILKIASFNTLHFMNVYVNDEEYSLFHFRDFTVADALLNAGIQMRKFNGRPGLGLMVTVEGEKKSFPGTMGTLANITVNGKPADLDTPIDSEARIAISRGIDGQKPIIRLSEVINPPPPFTILINEQEVKIVPKVLVNGEIVENDQVLNDGDVVETRVPRSIGEALKFVGLPPTGLKVNFKVNGSKSHTICSPKILKDDQPIPISEPIHPNDSIEYIDADLPKLGDVINVKELQKEILFFYEGKEYTLDPPAMQFEVNGRSASVNTIISEGAEIRYQRPKKTFMTISDALLAVNFETPAPETRTQVKLLINGRPVEFNDPIKSGDTLEIVLKTPEEAEEDRKKMKSESKFLDSMFAPKSESKTESMSESESETESKSTTILNAEKDPEPPKNSKAKQSYAASLIARLQAQINHTNAVGNSSKVLKKNSTD